MDSWRLFDDNIPMTEMTDPFLEGMRKTSSPPQTFIHEEEVLLKADRWLRKESENLGVLCINSCPLVTMYRVYIAAVLSYHLEKRIRVQGPRTLSPKTYFSQRIKNACKYLAKKKDTDLATMVG